MNNSIFNYWWGIAEQAEYNAMWDNMTGYFDNVVKSDFELATKFVDSVGRRVIVVPLKNEYVVMNERYRDDNDTIVICHYRKVN